VGFEPSKITLQKPQIPESPGAESGALSGQIRPDDADLAEVLRAWPGLPPVIKSGILAMIRAAA